MRVYRTQTMRTLEAALPAWGLSTLLLMEQAAQGLFQAIHRAEQARKRHFTAYLIFCGWGNNGGDGYALARHLVTQIPGARVFLYEWRPTHERTPDAEANRQAARAMGIPLLPIDTLDPEVIPAGALLVDALFGTGLRPISDPRAEPYATLLSEFQTIHQVWQTALERGATLYAIDLLSGISADTGARVYPTQVRAEATLALGAPKPAHYLLPALDCRGRLEVLPLTIPVPPLKGSLEEPELNLWQPSLTPEEDEQLSSLASLDFIADSPLASGDLADSNGIASSVQPPVQTWSLPQSPMTKPKENPQRRVHKGLKGSAVIMAGDEEMAGAGILATEAAFAAGAGRVYAWLPSIGVSPALQRIPHALIQSRPALPAGKLKKAARNYLRTFAEHKPRAALLVGPGIPSDERGHDLLDAALRLRAALVLDATALRLLAERPQIYRPILAARAALNDPIYRVILTPHVGEYLALRQAAPPSLQSEDLFSELVQMADYWHANLLYKSSTSYYAHPLDTTEADQSTEEMAQQRGSELAWIVEILPYGTAALARGGSGDILAGYLTGRLAQVHSHQIHETVCECVALCGRAAEWHTLYYGQAGYTVEMQLEEMRHLAQHGFYSNPYRGEGGGHP